MTQFGLRLATPGDFVQVRALYKELVGKIDVPDGAEGLSRFHQILGHPGTVLVVAESGGQLVSAATLHILPNLTFGGRPYALVENVVTAKSKRGKGAGRAVVMNAVQRAWDADCYKIMLLTGRIAGARGFYEELGFSNDDKFGMTLRRAPKRDPQN